jgi:WD40 repeat protein
VAFSADGTYLLTGSEDNTARLWDIEGKMLRELKGHTSGVSAVAFSPDGKYLLTGSRDNTARLWDRQGNTIQAFPGHSAEVNAVAFSPDGKSVLTGSADNTARLWDIVLLEDFLKSGSIEPLAPRQIKRYELK